MSYGTSITKRTSMYWPFVKPVVHVIGIEPFTVPVSCTIAPTEHVPAPVPLSVGLYSAFVVGCT